ncbi:MAG: AI-2E family transporter, partial [Cyanobacteriota bacterium]
MGLRSDPGRGPSAMGLGQWLGLLALLAALVLLWQLRESLVLLFSALVIAQALCTLVDGVRQRLGCSRPRAVVVSLLLLLLVLVVIATAVIPPFVDQFAQLLLKLPAAALSLLTLLRQGLASASQMLYGSHDPSIAWLRDGLLQPGTLSVPAVPPELGGGLLRLLGLAGNLGTGLLQLVFVLAVALMVAAQPTAYREVAVLLVPSFYRRRFRQVLVLCGTALSAWMVGVVISSVCVGSLAALGLWLLGVKLVAANAVLAGLLNVIPNIGPTL